MAFFYLSYYNFKLYSIKRLKKTLKLKIIHIKLECNILISLTSKEEFKKSGYAEESLTKLSLFFVAVKNTIYILDIV